MKRRPFSISIRTALVAAMLAMALVPALLIGGIGVFSISESVRREAQSRVNQDLEIVLTAYQERLERLAAALEAASRRIDPAAERLPELLPVLCRELGLTVLNLCDTEGRPRDGRPADLAPRVPLEQDPVLRQVGGAAKQPTGHCGWIRVDCGSRAARLCRTPR